MNLQNLYGYWKMTGMRYLKPDGSWEQEQVLGGSSVITQSGEILTYTRTSELGFGYSGQFTVEKDSLVTRVDVCSIPELEKKVIRRTIKQCTPQLLILGMHDEATGRDYEIEFNLLTRTFTN